MKIIAYASFRQGITAKSITPNLLRDEMANVWRLQRIGVVREIYGRSDAPSAVVVLECDSVDEAMGYVGAFPLAKAGFLEWSLLPLTAPLPFEVLFATVTVRKLPAASCGCH